MYFSCSILYFHVSFIADYLCAPLHIIHSPVSVDRFYLHVCYLPVLYLHVVCCVLQGVLSSERLTVQCGRCGLYQHPECVHYNLRDPHRGPYLCPHCHVAKVRISMYI